MNNSLILLFALAGVGLLLLTFLLIPRQKQIWPIYLLSLSGLIFTEFTLESDIRKNHQKNLELNVTQQLNAVATKLIASINSNFSLVHGLATYISLNPDINQSNFERYAEATFEKYPLLLNMAAAPNLIIQFIHPTEGNEAAIGLNYRTNSAQRGATLRVMNTRKMVIAGPINMVQGGVAFIARAAVYIPSTQAGGKDTFWGIVSAPIDIEALYRSAGMSSSDLMIDISIRNEGLGEHGDTFYGDDSLFDDSRSLQTNINVGSDNWTLAAKPRQNWLYTGTEIARLRTTIATIAVILLLFLFYRQKQLLIQTAFENKNKQNENLLQEVGKLALISGWKVTPDQQVVQWGPLASKISGIPFLSESLPVKILLETLNNDQPNLLKQSLQKALNKGISFDIELSRNDLNENKIWTRVIGHASQNIQGKYEVTGAVQDITEKKVFTEVIQRQATYDILTELPNRFLFNDRLKTAITKAHKDNLKLAVLYIGLDQFKPINDNIGHKAGDILLQQMAHRISACVRDVDTVARYSGDEFTVILQYIDDETAPLIVAEQILEKINRPFNILQNQAFCTASIGISIYPNDGQHAEDLICNADHAMCEVKKSGRNSWHYFTPKMQIASERKHLLHSKLQQAVINRELEVFYQPIVDLSTTTLDLNTRNICKCEALVRWFDESGQMVPTEEFIAVAEETGLINDIDYFVLQQASQFIIDLGRKQGHRIGLSVNVSPRIFSAQEKSINQWLDLVCKVARNIDLTVEITERLLTQGSDQAQEILHKVKMCGAKVAIDDFGTGYSSLSYLTQFPIDIIKIDRSFTQKIGLEVSAETLTDTILSLASKLDMSVVAEGVENAAQLNYLQQRGCEYAQGYYRGKPQNARAFSELITQPEREEMADNPC